jgi:hypothetical protein
VFLIIGIFIGISGTLGVQLLLRLSKRSPVAPETLRGNSPKPVK